MSIKSKQLDVLQKMANVIMQDYALKSNLGTLAGKNEVTIDDLATALKNTINGKADAATTLEGYGITDAMTQNEITTAIATAISGADHLQRTVVESVDDINPSAEGADQYIYMVPKESPETGDGYDEYMVIDGEVEHVGGWKVDLSDYAKTTEVTQAIATALTPYAKTTDVTSAINTAISGLIKLTSLSSETVGTGNVVTGVEYNNTTGKTTVTKGITALQESDFEEITQQEINALFTTQQA